jgi:kynurenine formamidase
MLRSAAALTALVALCACTSTAPAPRAFDLRGAELVDLTWAFDDKTLYWPTSPSAFELKQLAYGPTPGGWFYSSNAICTPEHGGTHLDAPIHFAAGKHTADQIPLEQLMAPAVVIDVADRASSNADYRLSADDVRAWESRNGNIEPGTIVLLRTGWGARRPDRKSYISATTLPARRTTCTSRRTARTPRDCWSRSAASRRSAWTRPASTTASPRTSSSTRSRTAPTSPASRTSPTSSACRNAERS